MLSLRVSCWQTISCSVYYRIHGGDWLCKIILYPFFYQDLNCFAMARSNSSVHSPQKTKQKLTEEELLVLQSHLEEWKEATGKDRKTILRAVIKEAKMQAPKMDAWLLKKRKSVSSPSSNFINAHDG